MRLPFALLLLALVVALTGCNRFDASDPVVALPSTPDPGGEGVGSFNQIVVEEPIFAGIRGMIAGESSVRLTWEPAEDNVDAPEELFYRVYLATGPGDQDFAQPDLETAPGALEATVDGLPSGAEVYAVVRAVDLEGNEDGNRIEWIATPNPIRYVDAASTAPTPDGLSPATAYSALGQAIQSSVPLGGVNFYVAQATYTENIFLFPGMCVYGGFASDFSLDTRDPETFVTELFFPAPVTLVTVFPSDLLCGIDGLVLSGSQQAEAGVVANDCLLRVSNCQVDGAISKGIEIRSDIGDSSLVEGFIRGCSITGNLGEGIDIDALTDLVIDDNEIRGNGNEGIESQSIYGSATDDVRLEVTRNRISRNGDEGVDLDVAEVSEFDPGQSQGARVRIVVRNNFIFENGEHGLQIDLDFENSDGIDFRARIEDNVIRANALNGILLDGDARGAFRVARNVVSANREAGIRASGTSDGPSFRFLHNRILGNARGGIFIDDLAWVEVRHGHLNGNGLSALRAPRAHVEVVNSIFIDNAGGVAFTRLRNCIFFGQPVPPGVGPDVFAADPLLANRPERIAFASETGTATRFPLGDPSPWTVGSAVEVRDDGVIRMVVEQSGTGVILDPPLGRPIFANDTIFLWAGNEPRESEELLDGSPAQDAGDPLESDRDGTVPDLGPRGGSTPGNVGVETGVPLDTATVELLAIDPPPGFVQTTGEWVLAFSDDLLPDIVDSLRVLDGLGDEVPFDSTITGRELTVQIATTPAPGESVTLELLPSVTTPDASFPPPEDIFDDPVLPDLPSPFPRPEPGILQPNHILTGFSAGVAETDADVPPADANGTLATAQPLSPFPTVISGSIFDPLDRDLYALEVSAGDRIRVELIAGRDESPLVARLSLLAADGSVISTAAATPPTSIDPSIPPFNANENTTVYVQVESENGLGSPAHTYRCVIFRD